MKRSIYITTLFLLSFFLLFSCNKYDDGPPLSVRTKKARVAGDWRIDKYIENGMDRTDNYRAQYSDETVTFKKDGTFSSSATSTTAWGGSTTTDYGSWSFVNDEQQLSKKSFSSGEPADTMQILRLTNKDLWVKTVSGLPLIEIHYRAKK